MSRDQMRRIAAFLSEYTEADGCLPIPPNPVYIRDAIHVMVTQLGWTEAGIRRQALKDYNVMIPDDCFLT